MIHNTIKIRKRMQVSGTLAIPLCREIILLRIVIVMDGYMKYPEEVRRSTKASVFSLYQVCKDFTNISNQENLIRILLKNLSLDGRVSEKN